MKCSLTAIVLVLVQLQLAMGKCPHSYHQSILDLHNKIRTANGAGKLTMSAQLSESAQQWANHLASTDTFNHDHKTAHGENLYTSSGMNSCDSRGPVDVWYKSYGHCTQLTWKGTKELGVGVATSKSGKTYVVARYSPAGNVQGRYPGNAGPLCRY